MEVLIERESVHFYGADRECRWTYHYNPLPSNITNFAFVKKNPSRMTERFARYKVDGAAGWGICEWQYRNT